MKNIIFSNNLEKTQKILKKSNFLPEYIILSDNPDIRLINFLKAYGCKEINASNIIEKRIRCFRDEYVNFIAQLNAKNNTMHWWALNITGKSTLSSNLCKNIFDFLNIVDVVDRISKESILIIVDDIGLYHQACIYFKNSAVEVVNAIQVKKYFFNLIIKHIPIAIFCGFFRAIYHKIYSRLRIKAIVDNKKKYAVISTIIHRQSFTHDKGYRDVYFGGFADYLKSIGINPIVLAIAVKPYLENINKIRDHNKFKDTVIIPAEHFTSILDMLKCFSVSMFRYIAKFALSKKAYIEKRDVTYLVSRAIKLDFILPRFFNNLLIYYSTLSLLKRVSLEKFYHPFENRSWEKMAIIALKKKSLQTRIIGYQHTPVTDKHTELCLGRSEIKIAPLPDVVITGGSIGREWLEKKGNFPKEMLRVGCALRQWNTEKSNLKRQDSKKISNVLVLLSSSKADHLKTLFFIEKAFAENSSYTICIRPRPGFVIDKMFQDIVNRNAYFTISKGSLMDEFNWADVLIYSSPTEVALRAISFGIPVVYINIRKFLNSDPLCNLKYLKWEVGEPKDVMNALGVISNIPQEEFIYQQQMASEHALNYFYIIEKNRLKVFLS